MQRIAGGDAALHPPKHAAASAFSRRPAPAAATWRQQRERGRGPRRAPLARRGPCLDHGTHHYSCARCRVASLVQHSGVCAAVRRAVSPRPTHRTRRIDRPSAHHTSRTTGCQWEMRWPSTGRRADRNYTERRSCWTPSSPTLSACIMRSRSPSSAPIFLICRHLRRFPAESLLRS
jgi:hypothetical protein